MRYMFFLWVILPSIIGCSNKNDIDKLRFLEKGNQAFANREYLRAENYYNEAILKDSTFVDAWNNKGLALMKQEKFDEAIFCFNRAIDHKPDYGEAMLNSARANLSVKQYFAAAGIVKELKKVWPDTSLVYFTEGLIRAEQNEPVAAMQSFKQALVLDPGNAEIMVNIGNLFYHQHQLDSAIVYINRGIALDANESNAYNVLAMVYVAQENYEEALEAINTAISLNTKEPFYLNNKGYILFKLNRLPEAEENIIQSMKMDPYNGWVYRSLGLVRHQQGNLQDAIRLLEKALTMDNEIDNIYLDLASAYKDSGKVDKACETIRMVPEESKNKKFKNLYCH